MPKQWTLEKTDEAVKLWRDAWTIEGISESLGFKPATVSAKLRAAGEDNVSYGSISRDGLEGRKPMRLGEALPREKVEPQQVMYQPHEFAEQTINALLDNDLAETRVDAVAMLVEAGSRDPIVVAATNLEAHFRDERDNMKRRISEGGA